jgi:hypothetical protein
LFSLDEEIKVPAKGPTAFVKNYNVNQVRLAIRFTSNGCSLPIKVKGIPETQFFFVSNVITAGNSLFN